MYRLWIINKGEEPRFALENKSHEYLTERGEEWLRMMFIEAYFISQHEGFENE